VTIKCDFCDGDPQCALFCEVNAIRYVEADTMNASKKRDFSFKFSDMAKQMAMAGGR
jgi:carbon-monoxide dehydrogenase iron sulfur subunit